VAGVGTCMGTELFAGNPVSDYASALEWYERLLGEPSFHPNDIEAVWELAPHLYAYIVEEPEHAGHSVAMLMVGDHEDLDARIAEIGRRGLVPAEDESYEGGVRKVTYVDLDGNRLAFGGLPDDD
jgi:hypothetical protein